VRRLKTLNSFHYLGYGDVFVILEEHHILMQNLVYNLEFLSAFLYFTEVFFILLLKDLILASLLVNLPNIAQFN